MATHSEAFTGGSKGDSVTDFTNLSGTGIGGGLVKDGAGYCIGASSGYGSNQAIRYSGATTFTDDQYCEIVLGTDDVDGIGVFVRCDGTDGYMAWTNSNSQTIYDWNSSSGFSAFATGATETITSGQTLRCEVDDVGASNNVTLIVNGTNAYTDVSNSGVSVTGAGGCIIDDDVGSYATPSVKIDSVEMGDLAAGGGLPPSLSLLGVGI